VAISSKLAVNGAAQLQVANDCAGAQIKMAEDKVGDFFIWIEPVPKVSTFTLSGRATPIA
jgi:hypothetical protein